MRLKNVALAALAGAYAASSSAQAANVPSPERPRLVVDGYGQVKTMPDVASLSYTLRGEGTMSDDAVRAMVASGVRIEGWMRVIDPAAEPRTGKVKVSPARGANCKDEDYDSGAQLSKGACAVVGYVATQTVTIETRKVKDAGTMVGLAGRGGAYDARIDDFELSDPRGAQGQALAVALTNAGAKAAAITSASHLVLGPILNVSTLDRDVTVLTSEEVRLDGLPQANMVSPLPVSVILQPEPITTSAHVTVTYAIGQ